MLQTPVHGVWLERGLHACFAAGSGLRYGCCGRFCLDVQGAGAGCSAIKCLSVWQVCTLKGHAYSVLSVAFSPDGKHIVSGSQDNLVKVWDAETGGEVSRHTLSVHIFWKHPSAPG